MRTAAGASRRVVSVRLCLEADRVDGSVNLRLADDLSDLVFERGVLGEVDGLVADSFDVGEALGIHVADHDDRGAEDVGRGCGSHADRACAGNVDGGSDTDAGVDCPVEAGGEDVGEHGEVLDLRHGLGLVGERDEVEVGVGDHDVLGLAADPSAHVDVAVGSAGATGVDVEADSGLLGAAGAAAAASDVEGDGDEVSLFDVLDVGAEFDDFAGDLVAEDHAGGRGGAAADHVLIGAADVGGNDLQDDTVIDLLSCRIFEFGVVDRLNFDMIWTEKDDSAIGRHTISFSVVKAC